MSENPFEPEETESQQLNRVGKMIRENVDKKMQQKTYTQSQVDALIVGAYPAQRKLIEEWRAYADKSEQFEKDWLAGKTEHHDSDDMLLSQGAFNARRNCADELEQAITPDAARLALEEREKKVREQCTSADSAAMSISSESSIDSTAKTVSSSDSSLFSKPHRIAKKKSEFNTVDEWSAYLESLLNEPEQDVMVMPDGTTVSEREAKLIADTLRAAIDSVPLASRDSHEEWNKAIDRTLDNLKKLMPAAQAEERDRRVAAEAVEAALRVPEPCSCKKGRICWQHMRLIQLRIAHRAAVQGTLK